MITSAGTLATNTHAELDLVESFAVASTALAASRTLQERIDRKYLVSRSHLVRLLRLLQPEHRLLLANRAAWARYDSVYFDSAELDFYHAHRRGRMPRHKVRIRHHLDRGLTFLEIKRKVNCGRTVKFRLPLPFGQSQLGTEERQFIDEHARYDSSRLVPILAISFLRLTVVGHSANERLTIDKDLAIVAGGTTIPAPPAVIVEVKQSEFANRTPSIRALRSVHARQIAVSKYCLGTILSVPSSSPVFRPVLHALKRVSL